MNSLYEQLMAAKGAPRVGAASNTTQMREAPMNLRSAMRKYAAGGGVQGMTPQPQVPPPPQISASEINNFVQANLSNPQAIADAARQYGVSADALASATGYSGQQISDYFGKAGLSPFAPQAPVYNPPPTVTPIPPQKPYYDEPIYEPRTPQINPEYEDKRYDPRMPEIDKDPRAAQEAEELARYQESMRRQREAEQYYFKMLNEQRRARGEIVDDGYGDKPGDEPLYPEPDYTMPVFPKYDEPRMPQIAPDTREADELARDKESRKRQREEEAYFFKMLNERRAREEESRRDPRISPYTPRSPYSVPSSPKKNQVDEFQKLLQAFGQIYK
jgi:hypothetical protein